MLIREVRKDEKEAYDHVVQHPLQSWEWGEFRETTGIRVVRLGVFDNDSLKQGIQITFHPIPKTSFSVGYAPKSLNPDEKILEALAALGQKYNAVFIKLEPNVGTKITDPQKEEFLKKHKDFLLNHGCVFGRPLFTKHTFVLDLNLNEQELLVKAKPKTRYNTNLAARKGIIVTEDNSQEAFNKYLLLTKKTTQRQKFYAHGEEYHQKMWEIMYPSGIAHLLTAKYGQEVLTSWILFVFNNILYYPYGASDDRYRNLMASNLMMWEAIKFGKKMGCKAFDMWGSLGPDASPSDPWFGFHHFKEGYGPDLVEFIGTFDLVLNHPIYSLYNIVDNLRWKYLKAKAIFRKILPY